MNELTLSTRERLAGGGGLGSIFAEDEDESGAQVTVVSGHNGEQLPVGNMSVREIRARFRDRFDLDPRSQAVVDGNDVGEDTVVRAGQVLVFTHRAGEKGTGAD